MSFRRSQETATTIGCGRGVRRNARSNKKELKINCHKYGKKSHMSKDCRSRETSAFEVGEDGLAETGCIEMESIQFLMFGRVQLSEKGHRVRIGIDSCAAVIVFPKIVADDYPMLQTASKAKSYGPASGKPSTDLGARKVQVKLKDGRYVNPIVAYTHRALMAVSEMNDLDTMCSSPERQRHQGVCVPRGQWHEAGAAERE